MGEEDIRETVRQTFEAIAEHFDKTRYKPWPETVEYVESLPERSRVLDIGCGNGRNMILPRRLGHEVVGIDFSMNLLKIAQEKLEMRELDEETHLLGGDAAIMPLKDDTFDSALYIATLHHIPSEEDRLRSLKDLKRCLKPGGTALISVWALDQPKFEDLLEKKSEDPNYADTFLPWTRSDGKVFQRFYHLFEKDELRGLVMRSGLEIENYFFSSDNYFARVIKGG
ncbi:MAG: class I SAM-dependent methyltransferase [Thermoplasmata archaeon]|nr:class I SAM-dependent methyltransferase [Thermoplasmata archaeon]